MHEFEIKPIPQRPPARLLAGGWAWCASAVLHGVGAAIIAAGASSPNFVRPRLVGNTQVVQAPPSISAKWSQPVDATSATPVVEIEVAPVKPSETTAVETITMESASTLSERQPLRRLSRQPGPRASNETVERLPQTVTPTDSQALERTIREPALTATKPPAPQPLPQTDDPIRKRPAPASTAAIASASTPDAVGTPDQAPPTLIFNRKPEYPAAALRNGWEGRVLLKLQVAAKGHVEDVVVLRTSGFASLDNAAREAVETWRFLPAQQNGEAIATTVEQPIIFQLRP